MTRPSSVPLLPPVVCNLVYFFVFWFSNNFCKTQRRQNKQTKIQKHSNKAHLLQHWSYLSVLLLFAHAANTGPAV